MEYHYISDPLLTGPTNPGLWTPLVESYEGFRNRIREQSEDGRVEKVTNALHTGLDAVMRAYQERKGMIEEDDGEPIPRFLERNLEGKNNDEE